MSTSKIKTMGEGGTHVHRLESPEKTLVDGMHKHLFFINDRLLMTDLSGQHWHPVSPSENRVGPEPEPKHKHLITISTEGGVVALETDNGTEHPHELQVENTTLSGLHTHIVEINEENFLSLLPGDLIEEVEAQSEKYPAFKNFNFKKFESPIEMNFQFVKRLNKTDMKEILKAAVVRSHLKLLSRLSEGLRIESLILSRERFIDIGDARRFVMDHGVQVNASEERDNSFLFNVMSKDKFDEASLQRIRVTDGVVAVVGFLREGELGQQLDQANEQPTEASQAETLTENAVESEPEASSVEATIDEMTDRNKSPHMDFSTLQQKFLDTMGNYGVEEKSVQKSNKQITKFFFEILKQDLEKRLITGPVLIPENIDLQDDIISADEIEKAGHNYMIKLSFAGDPEFLKSLGLNAKSHRGFMHVEFNRKIALVESYMAPVDFELNGRMVTKGTWVMTVKVFDDEIWSLVKAGRITGFSIGGRSKVIPEKKD